MSDLILEIEPDTGLIISAYETEDDVGRVLRVHLVIESQIVALINSKTRAKVDGRTSFYSKVNLLRAMDVPEKICVACEEVNKLRNQFAHNPKATLANCKSIAESYLNAVEAFCPILPQSHGTFVRKETQKEHQFEYVKATLAQRIVVAASFMSAIMGALPKTRRFGATHIAQVAGFDI